MSCLGCERDTESDDGICFKEMGEEIVEGKKIKIEIEKISAIYTKKEGRMLSGST